MAFCVNQVFENKNKKIKENNNWAPVTQTLERFITEIRTFLGDETLSDEQEVYMYLVVLEDFDAYYDGRYMAIVDTWGGDVWKTKSAHWQEIFTKAWMEQLAYQNDEQQYFRPSKLLLNKSWMERNGMGNVEITPIKSISFHD